MAKVLIQKGVEDMEEKNLLKTKPQSSLKNTEGFRSSLESQETIRLKGAPKRVRIFRPS